jgi:hypothetical protein
MHNAPGWVVAIDRVPFFSLENSWAICLMLSTLRRISPAVVMMRSPAGDAGQVLAAAGEHFDAKFVFQQADLFTDARLRGVKALGGSGNVEVVVRHFPDVAQLLKLHMYPSKQVDATGISDGI